MHLQDFFLNINLNKYPMDNNRKGGAKPRNMEVSRESRSVAENSGSTMDKPTQTQ